MPLITIHAAAESWDVHVDSADGDIDGPICLEDDGRDLTDYLSDKTLAAIKAAVGDYPRRARLSRARAAAEDRCEDQHYFGRAA